MGTWVVQLYSNKYLVIGIFAVQVSNISHDAGMTSLHEHPVPQPDGNVQTLLLFHASPVGSLLHDGLAGRAGTSVRIVTKWRYAFITLGGPNHTKTICKELVYLNQSNNNDRV